MTIDDKIFHLEMSMRELARQLAEAQKRADETIKRGITTEMEIDRIKRELERYKFL